MPRPGYEANDDARLDAGSDLLDAFDPETRADLVHRLQEGTITRAHIGQLYRLQSASPEDRDPESVAALLDTV